MAAGSWSEYKLHILAELERLDASHQEQWEVIRDTREDYLLFKGKLIGIAFGCGAIGALGMEIIFRAFGG